MTRIQTACYALLASAFVLAGMLLVQLPSMSNTAEASLVISRNNFTLLTAKTRSNEESLFVINNATDRLLIYTLDLGRKRIELSGTANLADLFSAGRGGGNDNGRGRR